MGRTASSKPADIARSVGKKLTHFGRAVNKNVNPYLASRNAHIGVKAMRKQQHSFGLWQKALVDGNEALATHYYLVFEGLWNAEPSAKKIAKLRILFPVQGNMILHNAKRAKSLARLTETIWPSLKAQTKKAKEAKIREEYPDYQGKKGTGRQGPDNQYRKKTWQHGDGRHLNAAAQHGALAKRYGLKPPRQMQKLFGRQRGRSGWGQLPDVDNPMISPFADPSPLQDEDNPMISPFADPSPTVDEDDPMISPFT